MILELESSHERGSLSPLIFGYFIILMAAAFAITDISEIEDKIRAVSDPEVREELKKALKKMRGQFGGL